MENTKSNRIVYYDVLNIMAIIAVIGLHMNGIVHDKNLIGTSSWATSLIAECIFYWAVPIFMMLTGAKLMDYRKKYDTKTFFRKRFYKIFIPLLFWSIISFIPYVHKHKFGGVTSLISIFLNCEEQPIYYFMFEILGVYLTLPLISLLTKSEYRKTLWFTCILFFVFNGFIPDILRLFDITWNQAFSIKIGGYIMYVILGYLLSTKNIEAKWKKFIYIGAIVGLIYRYLTMLFLSKYIDFPSGNNGGYFDWHCILLSMAIFILIKDLNIDKRLYGKDNITKTIANISNCSFGIYLSHLLIRSIIVKLLHWSNISWSYRTIGILVIYLVSLAFVYIIKKIPILRKIVP